MLKRGKSVLKTGYFSCLWHPYIQSSWLQKLLHFVGAAAANYHVGSHMHKRSGNMYWSSWSTVSSVLFLVLNIKLKRITHSFPAEPVYCTPQKNSRLCEICLMSRCVVKGSGQIWICVVFMFWETWSRSWYDWPYCLKALHTKPGIVNTTHRIPVVIGKCVLILKHIFRSCGVYSVLMKKL